jgi:hypothetical protein
MTSSLLITGQPFQGVDLIFYTRGRDDPPGSAETEDDLAFLGVDFGGH